MLRRPEKSKRVFISYRRKPDAEKEETEIAYQLYENLTEKGYDVFYDKSSIGAGYFYTQIIDNIKVREHYILLIEGGTLDRCGEENDWVRREIETAIEAERNIIFLWRTNSSDKFNLSHLLKDDALDETELARRTEFLQRLQKLGFFPKETFPLPENTKRSKKYPSSRRTFIKDFISTYTLSSTDQLNSKLAEALEKSVFNLKGHTIPIDPLIEARIPDLKKRLVIVTLSSTTGRASTVNEQFIKRGFDIEGIVINSEEPYLDKLDKISIRDAVIFVGSVESITELSNRDGNLYRLLLFAHDYNKLIIPIVYQEAFSKYSMLPEQLIALFLLNAFQFQVEGDAIKSLFDRLAGYLSGSLVERKIEDQISDENRRRGIIAYRDKRYEEGDLHFEFAAEAQGIVEHVRAVAYLVWGINRLNRWQETQDESDKTVLEGALENFEEVTKTFPKLVITWLYKARTNHALKQYDTALKVDFAKIENILGKRKEGELLTGIRAEVAVWKSLTYYENGQEEEAFKEIQELSEDTITGLMPLTLRAEAHLLRARSEKQQALSDKKDKASRDSVIKLFEKAKKQFNHLRKNDRVEEISEEIGKFREEYFTPLDSVLSSRFNLRNERLVKINQDIQKVSDQMNIAIREFDKDAILNQNKQLRELLAKSLDFNPIVRWGSILLDIHVIQTHSDEDDDERLSDILQESQAMLNGFGSLIMSQTTPSLKDETVLQNFIDNKTLDLASLIKKVEAISELIEKAGDDK